MNLGWMDRAVFEVRTTGALDALPGPSANRAEREQFLSGSSSTHVLNWLLKIGPFALLVLLADAPILVGQSGGRCPVSQKERRVSRRFLMRLPLTVRWTDESVVGEASTESREVSSRGPSFHLPKGLKSGSPVEIVMTLPHELTQAGPVRASLSGTFCEAAPSIQAMWE